MKYLVIKSVNKFPMLSIEAENPKEKKQLSKLSRELHKGQFFAIPYAKADRFNTCGSCSDSEGTMSLAVGLMLGGEAMGAVWYPDNDKLIREKQRQEIALLVETWNKQAEEMEQANTLFDELFKEKQ